MLTFMLSLQTAQFFSYVDLRTPSPPLIMYWYAGDSDDVSESLRQLTTDFLEVETDPDTHPLLPSPATALCEFLLCLNKRKYAYTCTCTQFAC